MSSAFISNITPARFISDYRPKVKNGRFTFVNNSTVEAIKDGKSYMADISLSHDFQISGANVKAVFVPECSDYSGINKKYISEEGMYDLLAAVEEFARSGVEKRLVKEDTFSILSKQTRTDSHEAYLYNMLISWYKAELYKCSGSKDGHLRIRRSAYSDSHCKYDYNGSGDGIQVELELGPPVGEEADDNMEWSLRGKNNYWDKPYVLHYNASGHKQSEFYLVHVLGRSVSENLNFVFDIPGLDTTQLLLDPVNARGGGLPTNFDNIPWDKPDTIWSWILDYVQLNRLQQQFASALEMLGALAYQPKWSSLEACTWQSARMVATLAEFSPTRARIRGSLEGEQYVSSSMPHEFVAQEGRAPSTYIMKSALLNYYVWYGYYAILDGEARSRNSWRSAFTSVDGDLSILMSPNARAAAASTVLGKEILTNAGHGCGVYIDTAPMATITRMAGVEPIDGTVGQVVPIEAIYAPVSGALVAGTMCEELVVTQHLAGVQHLPECASDTDVLSDREVIRVANMYRMFGHDVTTMDVYSGQEMEVWSNVRECVIEPTSTGAYIGRPNAFRVISNRPRAGRHHTIPNVANMLDSKNSVFAISKPSITICEWQQRRITVRPFVTIRSKKPKLKFFIKSGFGYTPDTFRARAVEPVELGFQQAEPSMVPSAPAVQVEHPATDVPAAPGHSTAETAE